MCHGFTTFTLRLCVFSDETKFLLINQINSTNMCINLTSKMAYWQLAVLRNLFYSIS